MGYDTRYTVERVVGCDPAAFYDVLRDLSGYDAESFEGHQPCKWYDHDEHIASAMLKLEVREVDLHGAGEEQGDVWDKEYRLVTEQERGEHVELSEFRYTLTRPGAPSSVRTLRGP